MSDFPFKIVTSEDCPPDQIALVPPRKHEIRITPDGKAQNFWLETVEEWASRCVVITGLKV